MRATVTINSRGGLTLLARLRRALGLCTNTLIAELTREGLLLRPLVAQPVEVYARAREREFDAGEAELAAVLRVPARRAGAVRKRAVRRRR